jgi:predicted ABC-type ATPase
LKNKKPILIVIAGPNGSGKTSITSKILKHDWIENCVYINPDNIANELFGDWNSQSSVLQAAQYAQNLREKCLEENTSLIFETVLSAEDKIDFIYRAKQKGFFVRVFFVGTDNPKINASRIVQRVMEGGHDVPISKIISRFSKSIANCAIIAQFIDRLYVYDNSVEYKNPKLLFRSVNGKIKKTYHNMHDWTLSIFDTIQK